MKLKPTIDFFNQEKSELSWIFFKTSLKSLLLVCLMTLPFSVAYSQVGAVYAMTNGEGQVDGIVQGPNAVVAYAQAADGTCLLYTSPSPRDRTRSRMPSSA